MHPEEIKAAMRMRGVTPAALADQLHLAKSTVSQVINGKGTSRRVQEAIAKILGKSVEAIWPPAARVVLRRKRHEMRSAVTPSRAEATQ